MINSILLSFAVRLSLYQACFHMLGFIVSLCTKDKAEYKPDSLGTNQRNFMWKTPFKEVHAA